MVNDLARKALRSPALQTAAVLTVGGVGFALGNLLLARVLPESQFGIVALLLSLIQVGSTLGTLGLPNLVLRHHIDATANMLRLSAISSVLVGVVIASLGMLFYQLPLRLTVLMAATVALASVGRVAAAFFQSREYFGTSLLLLQIQNWLLLATVPVVLLIENRSAETVMTVMLCSYLVTTGVGWKIASRLPRRESPSVSRNIFWREGVSASGVALASTLLFQLDRLLIGSALSLDDVATYSVVMAISGSAFRMLQVGAGHSLVPRLRAATQLSHVAKILSVEAALVFGIGALAAAVIIVLVPWVLEHLLHGRYRLPRGMLAAVITVGFIRIVEAFAVAVVGALGSASQLSLLNVSSWAAVAVATGCALWAAKFGLVGVVCGLGVGWFTVAVSASLLAKHSLKHLKRRDAR